MLISQLVEVDEKKKNRFAVSVELDDPLDFESLACFEKVVNTIQSNLPPAYTLILDHPSLSIYKPIVLDRHSTPLVYVLYYKSVCASESSSRDPYLRINIDSLRLEYNVVPLALNNYFKISFDKFKELKEKQEKITAELLAVPAQVVEEDAQIIDNKMLGKRDSPTHYDDVRLQEK